LIEKLLTLINLYAKTTLNSIEKRIFIMSLRSLINSSKLK